MNLLVQVEKRHDLAGFAAGGVGLPRLGGLRRLGLPAYNPRTHSSTVAPFKRRLSTPSNRQNRCLVPGLKGPRSGTRQATTYNVRPCWPALLRAVFAAVGRPQSLPDQTIDLSQVSNLGRERLDRCAAIAESASAIMDERSRYQDGAFLVYPWTMMTLSIQTAKTNPYCVSPQGTGHEMGSRACRRV